MTITAKPAASDARPLPTEDASRGSRATGIRSWVGHRPLLTFFVLSCLLSWWPAVLGAAGGGSGGLAGFGPFLAAIVVLGLTQGRAGVKDLLARMIRWRVSPRAYLAAVGLPVLVTGAAIGMILALGGAMPSAAALGAWTQIPLMLILMLVIPGMGGAWEEPGFRGFALGRLEERFGLSIAPLLLGAFWVVWHLPLFLAGAILWSDIVTLMAVSVVIAAVYHGGRESVLIAMLMHATNNTVGGEYARQLFSGADAALLNVFVGASWTLLAAALMIRQQLRRGSPA